jgi:hypothetical protein
VFRKRTELCVARRRPAGPRHKCKVAKNNCPWVLGTLFYKGVKFERGKNLSPKTQVFHFLFCLFSFAIIQFSSQKKTLFLGWENIGAACAPPLPPPPHPSSATQALIQEACGALFRSVPQTDHESHLAPILRTCGGVPPLPLCLRGVLLN